LKSSPSQAGPDEHFSWQSRVGKNSSFAEAVYHAALGVACVWSTSQVFRLLVSAYLLAMLILMGLGVEPIFIAFIAIAGALAIGALLVANAFARLIKLADQARQSSSK
jgi:diacylglycerol kinase